MTQGVGPHLKASGVFRRKPIIVEEQTPPADIRRRHGEPSGESNREVLMGTTVVPKESVPAPEALKSRSDIDNTPQEAARTAQITAAAPLHESSARRDEPKTELTSRNEAYVAVQTTVNADICIPGYEVLQVIGRGGMGVVYKARQLGLNRLVALKMVLSGKYASNQDLERFWREASAVASLSHPNIVQVYEVSRHEGYPFFSLEYIDGGTLADLLAKGPLSLLEAVKLVVQLADAVQYAHEQQIIHRDLKPANILIVSQSDAPTEKSVSAVTTGGVKSAQLSSVSRVPKITDFGVAKRLDETAGLTATGIVAGTPQYMSPEQALADPKNPPSPASDIYSLGVILYECLTGRVPIDGDNSADVMCRVVRDRVPAPSKFRTGLPKDLETICLKCLEKQPRLRYESAADLAADLRRWMEGRPIDARPVSRLEQAYRWCRRNRPVAGLIGGIMSVLLIGSIVSTMLMVRSNRFAEEANRNAEMLKQQIQHADQLAQEARENEMRANDSENLARDHATRAEHAFGEAAERLAETQLARREGELANQRLRSQMYALKSNMAYGEYKIGQTAAARTLLDQMTPKVSADVDPRGFEWWYLKQLLDPAIDRRIFQSEIGHLSLSEEPDVWRVGSGNSLYLASLEPSVNGHAPIPGGIFDKFASHLPSSRIAVAPTGEDFVLICDAPSQQVLQKIHSPGLRRESRLRSTSALEFSPDGKLLVVAVVPQTNTVEKGHLAVFNIAANREIRRYTPEEFPIVDAAFSPDGTRLVFIDALGGWHVWNTANMNEIAVGRAGSSACIVPNRDGSLIVVGGYDGRSYVIEPSTGRVLRTLFGHTGMIYPMTLASDGKTLATSGDDRSIRVWNIETGENSRTLPGHADRTTALCFSNSANKLVSGSANGEVNIWDCRRDPEAIICVDQTGIAEDVFRLPDGRWLTAGMRGAFRFVDSDGQAGQTFALSRSLTAFVRTWAMSADGRFLAAIVTDAKIAEERGAWLIDLTKPADQAVKLESIPADGIEMTFSPDGKCLATSHPEGQLRLTDVLTRKEIGTFKTGSSERQFVAFTSSGKELIAADSKEGVIRRVSRDGQKIWETKIRDEGAGVRFEFLSAFAMSPDDRMIAVATSHREIFLIDALSGKPIKSTLDGTKESLLRLAGHETKIEGLAFDPTGTRLASTSRDSMVRLWDVPHGNALLTLRGQMGNTKGVAFSPDGSGLATASGYELRIWDGRYARWRDDIRQISRNCRMHCVLPRVADDGLVSVSALFVNESNRRFKAPDWRKIDDRLRAVILLEGPEPGMVLPMTLFEMNRRRIGHTPFILFNEIQGGEAIPVEMHFETAGWPAGRYRLWFTHSNGGEYSGNEAEMTEFVLPSTRKAPSAGE